MRSKLLIISILCASFSANLRAGEPVKFTYGLEWGPMLQTFSWENNTYVTNDLYLMVEKKNSWHRHLNGFVMAKAGLDVNHVNFSLLFGWKGLYKGMRTMPVEARVTYMFNTTESGTFLIYGGAGAGVNKKSNMPLLADLGGGYKYKIGNGVSLDIGLGFQGAWAHPSEIWSYQDLEVVSADRVRNSNHSAVGVKIFMALNL